MLDVARNLEMYGITLYPAKVLFTILSFNFSSDAINIVTVVCSVAMNLYKVL